MLSRATAAALIALALSAPAAATAGGKSSGALVVERGPGARIDWTRGLVVARGAAAADLRAPSPQVARLAAERRARSAAQARLRELAKGLKLADGRTLAAALGKDKAAAARFDRAVARSLDLAVDHTSDGSVVLSAGLPIEAIRTAAGGPMDLPTGAGASAGARASASELPTALVVSAGKHLSRPAVGVVLTAGGERYAGPTVFASREAAVAADRLGPRPVRVKASGGSGGSLELAGAGAATHLAGARAAGALVVIVVAEKPN
ncbi:MAG TPA: hypothetical protein VFU21_03385 [Kofleriaceae bacterium]|nr:hypothetical protein [Kofleriaceae bacterium]